MKKEIVIIASILLLFILFYFLDSYRLGRVERKMEDMKSKIEVIKKDIQSVNQNLDESMHTLDFSLIMLDSSYRKISKDNEAFKKEFGRLQLNIQSAKKQVDKLQEINIPSIKDY